MPRHYRIIRKVIRLGRDGKVKKVRDYREGIDLEKVRAQKERKCGYHECPFGGVIEGNWVYFKVTPLTTRNRMGSGRYPLSKDYHFKCLPPEAQLMKRFFRNVPTRRSNA